MAFLNSLDDLDWALGIPDPAKSTAGSTPGDWSFAPPAVSAPAAPASVAVPVAVTPTVTPVALTLGTKPSVNFLDEYGKELLIGGSLLALLFFMRRK